MTSDDVGGDSMSSASTGPVIGDVAPETLVAQVVNAVLAAATLATAQGLPVQIAFFACTPLSSRFQATYGQHGRRRYLLALANATGFSARLFRLNEDGVVDMSLFDEIDRAFTNAFPEALRATVAAFYSNTALEKEPGAHRPPARIQ